MGTYNRREFIKLISAAIGGAMLTGCGSGGRSPNAYRFYRVATRGATVGSPGKTMAIDAFRGTVHISDGGIITFDAVDSSKRAGIFQVGVDFNGIRPRVSWGRTALITGETLTDGRVVSGFKALDVNDAGSIAADIVPTAPKDQKVRHVGSGLYLDMAQRGFEPVFTYNQQFRDGDVRASGILGDIDLHEDNEILVVTSFTAADANRLPGQGLLYLPGASVASAVMLMTSGDFVPAANYALATIGLVDLHDNGHYAVQGNALPLIASKATVSGTDTSHSALILTGNVKTRENHLLGAAPEMGAGTVEGSDFYGPRMTSGGVPYSISWDGTNETMRLYHGATPVLATGAPSPASGTVTLFSTGSVGDGDELFYTITSTDPNGQSLVMYDGADHSILLSSGDVLSDGGAPVEAIYFGATTKHADRQNRIVMFCSFTDGSSSLVVGLPV